MREPKGSKIFRADLRMGAVEAWLSAAVVEERVQAGTTVSTDGEGTMDYYCLASQRLTAIRSSELAEARKFRTERKPSNSPQK
jgi:hypothetical protein